MTAETSHAPFVFARTKAWPRANAMSSTSNNSKIALVQVEEGRDASVYETLPMPLSRGVKPSALAVKGAGSTNNSASGFRASARASATR